MYESLSLPKASTILYIYIHNKNPISPPLSGWIKNKDGRETTLNFRITMDLESGVPPGFRFHPTEEELIGYYLKRKMNSQKIDLNVITDIDLYRMEPWDIESRCKLGHEEQNEWYFFSHKDRKYPTGTRTNRATTAGFWKATGRDKAVLSKEKLVGMRKTLVFYKGRAPNGQKSDWIMHEYRHQTSEHGPAREEGWVVCRAFKKPNPSQKQGFEGWNNAYYIRNSSNNDISYPCSSAAPNLMHNYDPTPNQQTDFHQPRFPGKSCHSPYESQLVDLPKLDDSNYDWKSFDQLVASSSSSYASYPNLELGQDSEHELLDAHNMNFSYVLECFPDGL